MKIMYILSSRIILSFFVFVVICTNVQCTKNEKTIKIPQTNEEAIAFLEENSNYSDIVKEWKYTDFWPKEFFTINIENKQKKITYHENGKILDVAYNKKPISGGKVDKDNMVFVGNSEDEFKNFPTYDWGKFVDTKYVQKITGADEQKRLSLLYNALVGHNSSYIVLGKGRDSDTEPWKYYSPEDFPKYFINKDKLKQFVCDYINSINKGENIDLPFDRLVERINVKAISWDYRADLIRFGTDSAITNGSEIQRLSGAYKAFNEQGLKCGLVVPLDDDKPRLAEDFYASKENVIYLKKEQYNLLKDFKFNKNEEAPERDSYSDYFYVLLVLGLVALWHSRRRKQNARGISSTQSEDSSFQNKIDEKEILKKFLNSDEYKRIIKEREENAIRSYKNSNDFLVILKEKESQAVQEYINGNDYATAIKERENKAINRYKEGQDYKALIQKAEYADKIRVQYEKCKKLASDFGERKEYKNIISRVKTESDEIITLERMAIMLWSMDCTNTLLEIFGKDSFKSSDIELAREKHKDDILKMYATRVFHKYMDKTELGIGELPSKRDEFIARIISEVKTRYNIQLEESLDYTNFVTSFDNIYDSLRGARIFIESMEQELVAEFVNNERNIQDKGEYLSSLIAIGLHTIDYVRYKQGANIDYCPNVKYLLSHFANDKLSSNAEFRYRDPQYSGNYTNRVYDWLLSVDIKHLKALIGGKLILP